MISCLRFYANFCSPFGRDLHISEALQMQIEVQRRLNEQLEVSLCNLTNICMSAKLLIFYFIFKI